MEKTIVSFSVKVLTPAELFDMVQKEICVRAYSIYHKSADEVMGEDIKKALLSNYTAYRAVEGGEEIYYEHWPAEYYQNKADFSTRPSNSPMEIKVAYIVLN